MKDDFKSVSIVVPTRNRCNNLKRLFKDIRQQSYPKNRLEVIIVDNASIDSTQQVVYELNKSKNKKVKYTFEPRVGVHNAVNRGVLEAKNEIIVIIDDDTTFKKNYLKKLLEVYIDNEVSCAGGKIIPLWEDGFKSKWIEGHEYAFGVDFGPEKKLLYWPKRICGASFSARRDVFLKVGGWNPGRKYGGDGECGFCKKIYDIGGKIMWVPEAIVWHEVSANTITLQWMKKRAFEQGICNSYTYYRSQEKFNLCNTIYIFLATIYFQFHSFSSKLRGKNLMPSQLQAIQYFSWYLNDIRLLLSKTRRQATLNDDHLSVLINTDQK